MGEVHGGGELDTEEDLPPVTSGKYIVCWDVATEQGRSALPTWESERKLSKRVVAISNLSNLSNPLVAS